MSYPSTDQVQSATGDRYEVDRLLAVGGMGAVYLGKHKTLGSAVAIKVLPPQVATSEVKLARFKREAALTANLSHPHIVPVFEFDVRENLAFLVMPFIEGKTLKEYIEEKGRLSLPDVSKLLREIGSALSFAHGRGIVHRDIKPQNILLEHASGRWLVTDFGVAHVAEAEESEITKTGASIGTPAYMAPEQHGGAADVDERADLYALAAVAYEALTGERPDVMAGPEELTKMLRAGRQDLNTGTVRALTAPLALARDQRPSDVNTWLGALATLDGKRRRVPWSAVALAGVGVLAVGWWFQRDTGGTPSPGRPSIAVLPFVASELARSVLPIDLDQALAWQLQMLPDYQVIGAPVVQAALTREFGREPQALDALLTVTEELGATLAVAGQAEATEGRLTLRIQVHDTGNRRVVATADTAGPLDSLHALVSGLVVQAFAARVAKELTGWSNPSLPRGLPAISAYFQGDREFRSGGYEQAIEQFDRVIELDSTYAPAHFKRMLALLNFVRPTATGLQIRSALAAASEFKERLDPVSRRLLEGYQILLEKGDLKQAELTFRDIVRQSPAAVDAWFLLGSLQFRFGALLGTTPAEAGAAFHEVLRIYPSFAAAVGQLAIIAALEGDQVTAQSYIERYLELDSSSVRAEFARAMDTLLFRRLDAPRVTASFPDRPVYMLENVAFAAGDLSPPSGTRPIGTQAAQVLWERATTGEERTVAFRMRMAIHLGSGREEAAREFLREARRRGVRQGEIDRWVVLSAVTHVADLADPATTESAARRLTQSEDDALVSRWLAARWYREREPDRAAVLTEEIRQLASEAGEGSPLENSLLADLTALDLLAQGDTAAALEAWTGATQHYNIQKLVFGLTASLWPLRLERARVAEASARFQDVLDASESFTQMAGFVDQVAWTRILPLRAKAALAIGDTTLAITTLSDILRVLSQPEGHARAVRQESEEAVTRLIPSSQ